MKLIFGALRFAIKQVDLKGELIHCDEITKIVFQALALCESKINRGVVGCGLCVFI